jgi:hypothetical protein
VIIHTPLRGIFHTVALTGMDWVWILLISSSVFVFDEVFKMIKKIKKRSVAHGIE